jgi:hypothetical protein
MSKNLTKEDNMEYIGTYGNYSHNTSESYQKSRASLWEDDKLQYYKSYNTIVAFQYKNNVGSLVVCHNHWSTTTGKHLNWIDGGDVNAKKRRLPQSEFNKELEKARGQENKAPDQLKMVGLASAMFGILSENDKEAKVKFQKRFYENVPGLHFPDDWDQLSTEEKEKRLNNVNKVALEKREE